MLYKKSYFLDRTEIRDRRGFPSLVCWLNLVNLDAMEKSVSSWPWICPLHYGFMQCLTAISLSFFRLFFPFLSSIPLVAGQANCCGKGRICWYGEVTAARINTGCAFLWECCSKLVQWNKRIDQMTPRAPYSGRNMRSRDGGGGGFGCYGDLSIKWYGKLPKHSNWFISCVNKQLVRETSFQGDV